MLLLAAFIWGFAFVAQSESVKHIGPFTYNGIRFALGSLCILPIVLLSSKKNAAPAKRKFKEAFIPGLIAGIILFAGSFLQTLGIAYTTVGKAAFITGLYIVFVPVAGIFLKHSNSLKVWISVVIAAAGLYLLCVQGDFTIAQGDAFVLACAVLFTAHILLVDKYSKTTDVFAFAFTQSAACSVLSLAAAFLFEDIKLQNIFLAGMPILYSGIFSAGRAYYEHGSGIRSPRRVVAAQRTYGFKGIYRVRPYAVRHAYHAAARPQKVCGIKAIQRTGQPALIE